MDAETTEDVQSEDALVRRYLPLALGVAKRSFSPRDPDLDACRSDAILALLRAVRAILSGSWTTDSPAARIAVCCRRAVIDGRRRRLGRSEKGRGCRCLKHRHPTVQASKDNGWEELPGSVPEPGEAITSRDQANWFLSCLSPAQQITVRACVMEGCEQSAVARRLGVSGPCISLRIKAALAEMRERWQRRGG